MAEGGTRLEWTPFTLRHRSFLDAAGERVHGAGFEAPGRRVLKVAGVSFRAEALQSARVRPFQPLSLVPELDNPADPNAVGVWDAAFHDARRLRAARRGGVAVGRAPPGRVLAGGVGVGVVARQWPAPRPADAAGVAYRMR